MSIANDPARFRRRLHLLILAIALTGMAAAQIRYGWRVSVGFFLGCIASWWNSRNIYSLVESLGTSEASAPLETAAWILFRFLVLAVGAFVILKLTEISVYAACAGLFASAAAVILEAIFELTYER